MRFEETRNEKKGSGLTRKAIIKIMNKLKASVLSNIEDAGLDEDTINECAKRLSLARNDLLDVHGGRAFFDNKLRRIESGEGWDNQDEDEEENFNR